MNKSIILKFTILIFFASCLNLKSQENKSNKEKIATDIESCYPVFSWDKVPVYFHIGGAAGLDQNELRFVASHSNFICLSNGIAVNKYGSTEKGIEFTAMELKKINPAAKLIFYWNSFLDYPLYEAHNTYFSHPEWWLKTKDGELDLKNGRIKRYDLSNPEVRNWWTGVAKNGTSGICDGIFMDAFNQVSDKSNIQLWREDKYNEIQKGLLSLVKETRQILPENKIILYNGIRNTGVVHFGKEFLPFSDAVLIEHFGAFSSSSKESMAQDIEDMISAGKMGKIVILKTWPGFSWLDQYAKDNTYDTMTERARKEITFPLACFLIAAQPYSYFSYTWGYQKDGGTFVWYPELDKPLGEPKSDAKRNGWEYSREFEYCDVSVNLENKVANINWKNTN